MTVHPTEPSAGSCMSGPFFVKRGMSFKKTIVKDYVRQEFACVRVTALEGSLGMLKEHYSLRRVKLRKKETEILYIFSGALHLECSAVGGLIGEERAD